VADEVDGPVEAQQHPGRRRLGETEVEAGDADRPSQRRPGDGALREHGRHGVGGTGGHHDGPGQQGRRVTTAVRPTRAVAVPPGRDLDPHQPALGHDRVGRGRDRHHPGPVARRAEAVEDRLPAAVEVVHVALHRQLHLLGDEIGRHRVEVGHVGRGARQHFHHLAFVTVETQLVEPGGGGHASELVGLPPRHPRQHAGQPGEPAARHKAAAGHRDRAERQLVDDVAPPAHAPAQGRPRARDLHAQPGQDRPARALAVEGVGAAVEQEPAHRLGDGAVAARSTVEQHHRAPGPGGGGRRGQAGEPAADHHDVHRAVAGRRARPVRLIESCTHRGPPLRRHGS
jgi:hypothetical protein